MSFSKSSIVQFRRSDSFFKIRVGGILSPFSHKDIIEAELYPRS
nr:MAG TPA: hypothetical protein [Caudoviricetes sp.]